jgi:hypothetical protein
LSAVAGFQVPVIPFVDVAGKEGKGLPVQIVVDVPKLKVGVRFGFTVTEKLVVVAHWPAPGVKV